MIISYLTIKDNKNGNSFFHPVLPLYTVPLLLIYSNCYLYYLNIHNLLIINNLNDKKG